MTRTYAVDRRIGHPAASGHESVFEAAADIPAVRQSAPRDPRIRKTPPPTRCGVRRLHQPSSAWHGRGDPMLQLTLEPEADDQVPLFNRQRIPHRNDPTCALVGERSEPERTDQFSAGAGHGLDLQTHIARGNRKQFAQFTEERRCDRRWSAQMMELAATCHGHRGSPQRRAVPPRSSGVLTRAPRNPMPGCAAKDRGRKPSWRTWVMFCGIKSQQIYPQEFSIICRECVSAMIMRAYREGLQSSRLSTE